MNNIIRSSFKISPIIGSLGIRQNLTVQQKRLFGILSTRITNMKMPNWSKCLQNNYSTKSEKELSEFLDEEIAAEQSIQKSKTIPSKIDGFEVKLDGSEVTLFKEQDGERIEVNFNINHSITSPPDTEISESANSQEDYPDLKCKPNFEVDIIRGDTTLGFTCSFVQDGPQSQPDDEEYDDDLFSIDEVTLYKGEWKETNYAVSGEVLDGYLYDLLLNLLEEKGVSNDFVEKMSDLATSYEHTSYISLLRGLKKFAA